jgi:hypothetical protein
VSPRRVCEGLAAKPAARSPATVADLDHRRKRRVVAAATSPNRSNEAAVIRLVGAADRLHDEWQASDRRYLSEASMAKLNPSDTGIVAATSVGDWHQG